VKGYHPLPRHHFIRAASMPCSSLLQLKENIAAFKVTLDKETLDAIDEIHLRRRNPEASD